MAILTSALPGGGTPGRRHGPATASVTDDAATHGFATAFAITAGTFPGAAALCGALIPGRPAPPGAPGRIA
jgi:threonine/homoserine/homoserine lactone efflux protein